MQSEETLLMRFYLYIPQSAQQQPGLCPQNLLPHLSFTFSACTPECRYAVVYDERYFDGSKEWDPSSRLYSFPWVLDSHLADIKRIAVGKAAQMRRREA